MDEELTAAEMQERLVVLLRSHVERCLQQIWDTPDLVTDTDGDYPYRWGTAACWVSVQPDPPAVRVFGYAARGVRPTAALLLPSTAGTPARRRRAGWCTGRPGCSWPRRAGTPSVCRTRVTRTRPSPCG